MKSLRRSALASLVTVLTVTSNAYLSFAQSGTNQSARVPYNENKVLWTSTSSNAEDFGRELAELYTTLYISGRLSLRPITVQSDSIETILRENGNLVGPEFPLAIDSLACDLNRDRCERASSYRPKLVTA